MSYTKEEKRKLRHHRIRFKIKGTTKRPRVSVFRSNQHIYIQFIDDEKGKTLLSMGDINLDKKDTKGKEGIQVSNLLGQKAGEKAKKEGIKKAVFDRGGFKYHGRVKSVVEGLREAGLEI